MTKFLCDECGREGNEEDLCADDEQCPYYDNETDEQCPGTCHVLLPELDRVREYARLLDCIDFADDCNPALDMASRVLRTLARVYQDHQLWTVDGSSGADDAAALYAILTDIGLEVP